MRNNNVILYVFFAFLIGMGILLSLVTMHTSIQRVKNNDRSLVVALDATPKIDTSLANQQKEAVKETIRVKVTDEENRSLQEAKVVVRDRTGTIYFTKFTDKEGFCDFEFSRKEYVYVVVSLNDYFDKKVAFNTESDPSSTLLHVCLVKQRCIAGIITDCSNISIPGARAAIDGINPSSENETMHLTATSSEDGSFSLAPVASGTYILSVSHPHYLPKSVECHGGDTQIHIFLKNTVDINVQTVDNRNNPLGGVDVQIECLDRSKGKIYLANKTTVRGIVDFLDVLPSIYSINASASFLGVSSATEVDARQSDRINVKLSLQPKLFSISGKVLESNTHNPVESATVLCQSQNKIFGSVQSATSDSQGEFCIHSIYPGEYSLRLSTMDGYMSDDYGSYTDLGVQPTRTFCNYVIENVSNVIIWAKPDWRLSGHVWSKNRVPLENAEVVLAPIPDRGLRSGYQGNTQLGETALTDKNGRYELIGSFDLTEKASVGVVSMHPFYGRGGSGLFKPKPGDRIENVDIVYENEPNVVGQVMNNIGKGIAGASVYFYAGANYQLRMGGFQVTDSKGKYGIHILPGTYTGRAQSSGYQMPDAEKTKAVTIPDTGVCTVNFQLQENHHTLEGIVLGENSVPIPDISIYGILYMKNCTPPLPQKGDRIAITDDEGKFILDIDKLDRWGNCESIKITAIPDRGSRYKAAAIYDIPLDSQNVTINMEEEAQDYSFEAYGTVLDSNSLPVCNFCVLLFPANITDPLSPPLDEWIPNWQSFHSSSGEFHIQGLDSRRSPFLFVARDLQEQKAYSVPYSFSPGEVKTDILIQFQNPYSIRGRVLCRETGNPLEGVTVIVQFAVNSFDSIQKLQTPGYGKMISIRQGDPRQFRLRDDIPTVKTDRDGRFVLQNIPAPQLCLIVMYSGYRECFRLVSKSQPGDWFDAGDISLQKISGGRAMREPDIQMR